MQTTFGEDKVLQDEGKHLQHKLYNLEMERELISYLIHSDRIEQASLVDKIDSAYFSSKEFLELFELISSVTGEDRPVNPFSIRTDFNARVPEYRKAVLTEYLEMAIQGEANQDPDNLVHYLKEMFRNRTLISGIETAKRKIASGSEVDDIINDLSKSIITAEATTVKEKSMSDIKKILIDQILNKKGRSKGLLTGLDSFDREFGGIKPDQNWVIGADSGCGKTAVCIDLMARLSIRYPKDIAILYVSLEMSEDRIMKRLVSRETGFTNTALDDPFNRRTADEKLEIWDAINKVTDFPITVVYQTLDNYKLRNRVRRFILENKGKHPIIFLDHVGLVDGDISDMRKHTIMSANTMKSFNIDYKATTFLLTQLKKEIGSPERRKTFHRPYVSDIMESGAVRANADNVILLWRPEYYGLDTIALGSNEEWNTKNRIIFLNEKNRDGQSPTTQIYQTSIATNYFENDPSPFA